MKQEIENKYLVNKNKLPQLKNGKYFVQAYLSLEPHIRIRAQGNKLTLTLKKFHSSKTIRDEWEFTKIMSKSDLKKIFGLVVTVPVEKIRYRVKYKELIWEVDVYQGANEGLVTVDVELKNKKQEIDFPDWVCADKEISHDPRYFNVNLGKKPYSSW
jgi:CYTH domain-containing protein